jgi:hypothetical protein
MSCPSTTEGVDQLPLPVIALSKPASRCSGRISRVVLGRGGTDDACRRDEVVTVKILYKPFGMIVSVVGGVLAGMIFKRLWKIAAGDEEVPTAVDARRGWAEVLLAATAEGAVFGLVKAAVDRGAATGFRKLTGIWPDESGLPDCDTEGKDD